MYGTVARMRVKPGAEEALREHSDQTQGAIPGLVGEYVYRMDKEPDIYYLAVMFTDKEAYQANATSPAQHDRYVTYRDLLLEEPEWHDGEIISGFSEPS